MRRALVGLALFACLTLAGWAWLDQVPQDVTGLYVRIVTPIDRDQVCAARTGVERGGMRVTGDAVIFSERTCEIAHREERSEDTAEGLSTTVELGLICGDDIVGPDELSGHLFLLNGRAELTSYIPDGDVYIPAHATFIGCVQAGDD